MNNSEWLIFYWATARQWFPDYVLYAPGGTEVGRFPSLEDAKARMRELIQESLDHRHADAQ